MQTRWCYETVERIREIADTYNGSAHPVRVTNALVRFEKRLDQEAAFFHVVGQIPLGFHV